MRSAQLVNRKQFYVSISRALHDARVYTNDAKALRQAVGRESKKEIALDAVKQRPTQQLKQPPENYRPAAATISDAIHRHPDLKMSRRGFSASPPSQPNGMLAVRTCGRIPEIYPRTPIECESAGNDVFYGKYSDESHALLRGLRGGYGHP
jgi:hypothetical protein